MEGVILHLAGDGELVAVEDDPLQVGQQVGLGARLRAPGIARSGCRVVKNQNLSAILRAS